MALRSPEADQHANTDKIGFHLLNHGSMVLVAAICIDGLNSNGSLKDLPLPAPFEAVCGVGKGAGGKLEC